MKRVTVRSSLELVVPRMISQEHTNNLQPFDYGHFWHKWEIQLHSIFQMTNLNTISLISNVRKIVILWKMWQ